MAWREVAISAETIRLFLFGLPVLLAGTWLGLKFYGRVNETTFRKIVLCSCCFRVLRCWFSENDGETK